MIAAERETVVTTSDGSGYVSIWTAQRKFITRLRKNPKAEEVKSGFYEGSEWAEFRIPSGEWNPATGIKRNNNLTEEQRRAASERLRAMQKGVRV